MNSIAGYVLRIAVVLAVTLSMIPVARAQNSSGATLRVTAVDESEKPVAGVSVQLKQGGVVKGTASTGENGEALFPGVAAGIYEVEVSKDSFETLTQSDVHLAAGAPVDLRITLVPKIELKESVTVNARGDAPVEQGASPSIEMQRSSVKELPIRPATVSETLPLVPGVARSPDGQIRISGAGEHRSAMVVNSADVTDPATGQFGVTVPVDSVETISVFKTPYLAQYGRFTAGVVSVETRRGGEKWNFEVNDPLPEFRIFSGHLRGMREASPRVTFNGPIIPGRFYFSEGVEYELEKKPIRTLPFPNNETKAESINSFSQFDYVFSATHTLTGTIHIAPVSMSHVGLEYFNPQSVTPNYRSRDYTGSIMDRQTLAGGLLESTVSIKKFRGRVWGEGEEDMILTPLGNRGNYFSEQSRKASRVEWLETFSLAPISQMGNHNLKFGTTVTRTNNRGEFLARPVEIEDANGLLLKRIEFQGAEPFNRSDLEVAFFGQDHWVINPSLSLDMGTRFEHQGITETFRIAPRIGLAWTPFHGQQTVVRTGFGLFYDRVPLSVYAFDRYPEEVVTTFGPNGEIIDGPRRFLNITDKAVATSLPFISRKDVVGNFAPYSATWNVEVEHPVSKLLRVRANYMQSNSYGIITVAPKVVDGQDAMVLGGAGESRYRQLELTSRFNWGESQQIFLSYVRSRARGYLNEFNTYLGNFPFPIVKPSGITNLPGDLPNRFLAWGMIRLPWKMRVSPMVEYRNGFPYAALDQAQNYYGVPNSDKTRFPNFYSLDARVSKDFQVSPKYTLRFMVSGFNITNHFNPIDIRSNIADPQYGTFFGNNKRRFRLDFDVLF